MKTNPFYALSVSAMLLGCWLLSQGLHLQAGRLGGLLVLMAVLQVYEGLLVGLGTLLVRTGRAPRDGVSVLVLESLLLMDAPLLAAECVTADARPGTAVALTLFALAVAKLAWVRRTLPGLLSTRAAAVLAVEAAFVLAVPVVSAHLAWARLLSPRTLWLLWWATLALPFGQRRLWNETRGRSNTPSSRAGAAWTWIPVGMALLHLWAVGYIHSIQLQPVFLAPLLLGLAATAERGRLARMLALPAVALVLSIGQGAVLGLTLWPDGALVSPFRLLLPAVVGTWAYLAWRDWDRGLAVLAACGAVAGLAGAVPSAAWRAVAHALSLLARGRPRDAFGWGVLALVAAFVFLAAGARRSLAEPASTPRGRGAGRRLVEKPLERP